MKKNRKTLFTHVLDGIAFICAFICGAVLGVWLLTLFNSWTFIVSSGLTCSPSEVYEVQGFPFITMPNWIPVIAVFIPLIITAVGVSVLSTIEARSMLVNHMLEKYSAGLAGGVFGWLVLTIINAVETLIQSWLMTSMLFIGMLIGLILVLYIIHQVSDKDEEEEMI